MNSDDVFRGVRKEYAQGSLNEGEVARSPLEQFKVWFDDALASGQVEPNACALGTAGIDGQPSVRMVLLKSYDAKGFVFFTNYLSRKGAQLAANPKASLLFYWPQLERQVRIEGVCEKIPDADTESYFHSRPRGARLGAVVSQQSHPVQSRRVIDDEYQKLSERLGDGKIERPPHWGGYSLVPREFEFWQGRESRLHDRLRYTQRGDGWEIVRLWP